MTALSGLKPGTKDYRQRLMAFAASEMAALISTTPFKDKLWLRNPKVLSGEESYTDRVVLRYVTPATIQKERLLEEILTGIQQWPRIFGKQTDPFFTAEGNTAEDGSLDIVLEYQNKHIPVAIYIRKTDDIATEPTIHTYQLDDAPERTADILEMSYEDEAAECLGLIFERLELISDMGAYGRLLELIKTESLRGHYIGERFEHICRDKNINLTEERMDLFLGYGDYIYMKRKWDKFKKRHKNLSYSWEETHRSVSKFAIPIYETVSRKEVFFGDWMPDLERFLD